MKENMTRDIYACPRSVARMKKAYRADKSSPVHCPEIWQNTGSCEAYSAGARIMRSAIK
jgi:hypothetical protein